MPPEGRTWRDASGAGAWTIRLLLLHAGLSAVAAGIAVLRGLQPPSGSLPEVAVALFQMAVFFAAAIATLRWLYLAKANAFAFGAEDMMVSPGWAIAWFFIPFANLVMPFIAMRETWKASAEPRDWQAAPAPVTLTPVVGRLARRGRGRCRRLSDDRRFRQGRRRHRPDPVPRRGPALGRVRLAAGADRRRHSANAGPRRGVAGQASVHMSDDRPPQTNAGSLALIGFVAGLLTVAALAYILLI